MSLSLKSDTGHIPKLRLAAVLACIILLSEIATFEITLVLPDLPHLSREFRTVNVAWAISIVSLSGATTLPLVGKAADRWGKKRTILALAGIFVVGSLMCALAPNFAILLGGRALQGTVIGVVALSYSLVRDIVPKEIAPVALGTVVTGMGMAALAGPFIAGGLIDNAGPRSVFWFMAIYVAVVATAFWMVVPESPIRSDRPVDYVGVVLLGPGIGILLLAVSKGSSWGWSSPGVTALFAVGCLMFTGFLWRQKVTPFPLLDPQILFGRRFGPTVLAAGCVSYVMSAQAYITPTLLETPIGIPGISYGAGLSAIGYAVWIFPLGLIGMVMGPLGGYISKRKGGRIVLIISAVLFIITMILGAQLYTQQWQIFIFAIVAGIAYGFLMSGNANLLQDALPASQSATGTSMGSLTMTLSASIATTITGVIMSHHVLSIDSGTHSVVYTDDALTYGFLSAAAVGAVGLLVALMMKHGRTPARGGMPDEFLPEASDESLLGPAVR